MTRDLIYLAVTMRQIAEQVAAGQGLTLDDLRGPSRLPVVVATRQAAMLAMWQTGRWSKSAIGRSLARHPKTALYGIRRARGESPVQARVNRCVPRHAEP